MDLKQMIGARIKEIRRKKGITQEQLSERMGINPKYLSSIERGKENPTLNTMISLAESLDVKIADLFSFLEVQDPAKRKTLIRSLLNRADSAQLKDVYKVLSAIID